MQVSDKQQLLSLIRSLSERTRAGVLEWRRTGNGSNYLLVMKTGGIILRDGFDESEPVDLLVLDPLGNELAHLDDFEPDEEVTAGLRRLYHDVEANLPQPRRAIDALLRELEAASA